MFEKWKREHDHLLKERYRERKEAESKQKLQKQEKEEERKRDSKSAFSNWWVGIIVCFCIIIYLVMKPDISVHLRQNSVSLVTKELQKFLLMFLDKIVLLSHIFYFYSESI